MVSRWLDSRILSAAPLAVVLLFFATFAVAQFTLTGCGGRLAGCAVLESSSITRLAPRDARPLASIAFEESAPPGAFQTDSAYRHWEGRRAAALKTVLSRYEGRLTWAFFSGLSAMLTVVSLLAAVALAHLAPEPRWLGIRGIGLVLFSAALTTLVMWLSPEASAPVMHPLLQTTIAADHALGMPRVAGVMAGLNAVRSGAAVALCVACWLLIQPQPTPEAARDADELDERIEHLRSTATYLRVFLYVGTASLVAGVLNMNATISWMQTFVRDGAALDPLRITLIGVIGGFYSLLLASLYLPSAFIIRERARRAVAEARVDHEVKEKALAGNAFKVSVSDVLPRVAALLAPVLAGPIGEFVKHMMSGS